MERFLGLAGRSTDEVAAYSILVDAAITLAARRVASSKLL